MSSVVHRLILTAAGIGVAAAALLHVAALIAGPAWFAFLGAPPGMVRSAAEGTWPAIVVTLAIAGVLAAWALYAFSAAGLIRPLPFRRTVLAVVAAIFLLRGAMVVPMLMQANLHAAFDLFHVAASAFVLLLGVAYAIGLCGTWHGR